MAVTNLCRRRYYEHIRVLVLTVCTFCCCFQESDGAWCNKGGGGGGGRYQTTPIKRKLSPKGKWIAKKADADLAFTATAFMITAASCSSSFSPSSEQIIAPNHHNAPQHSQTLPPLIQPAMALESSSLASSSSLTSMMDEQQLRQSLRPATAEQPQIMLPTDLKIPVEKRPIVEGLVSLSNPQKRPIPTDTIVITIRTYNQPDVILGGARIPITQMKFPMAFRLFPKNILQEKRKEWETTIAQQQDLLIQANVCKPDEDLTTCSGTTTTTTTTTSSGTPSGDYEEEGRRMQAQGVAKLIRNLPGQLEGQTLRAPVALPLQ